MIFTQYQSSFVLLHSSGSTSYKIEHALTGQPQTDAYLAHCKLHSDRTIVKKRRRAFLTHILTSRKRREDIAQRRKIASAGLADMSRVPTSDLGPGGSYPGETADIRILRKLSRHRTRYIADRVKTHDPWLPTQKSILPTHKSALTTQISVLTTDIYVAITDICVGNTDM